MEINLNDVRFCIRCGAALEEQLLYGGLRPSCPKCHWVYFADPKVAVAALVKKGEEVLLVQRIYNPDKGKWSLPAGFVDAREDPARAAERECLEETHLTVRTRRLLDVLTGREHPRGADIILLYEAELVGGDLAAGDDAGGAQFFNLEHLPPLAFHSTYRMLGLKNPPLE